MTREPHVLFLLNPGHQSRFYVLGLANAGQRLGLRCSSLELDQIWDQTNGTNHAKALNRIGQQMAETIRRERITHVVSYSFNGISDFGVVARDGGGVQSIFSALGVRHIMLWTDHPEWMLEGAALDDQPRRLLNHPNHVHIVKSETAASEIRTVLGWANVHASPMAEDYTLLRPSTTAEPVHDVVCIMGAIHELRGRIKPFLEQADPDPRDIDLLHREPVLRAFQRTLTGWSSPNEDACMAFARSLLDARIESPGSSFWRLSLPMRTEHADTIGWLQAEPRRWYATLTVLRRLVGWRRTFWPTWLARHVDVGIYGASPTPLGLADPPGGARWIGYTDQPGIYGLGRIALNINAAHDEEGLTHKPFQIAASGVACLHHESRGLTDCFNPGPEIATFGGGQELLARVRHLLHNDRARERMARAMRDRARRDHDWTNRLSSFLALAEGPVETGHARQTSAAG